MSLKRFGSFIIIRGETYKIWWKKLKIPSSGQNVGTYLASVTWLLSNPLFSPLTKSLCNLIWLLNIATCLSPAYIFSWYWYICFFFLWLSNSYVGIIFSQKPCLLHLHPTFQLNLVALCLCFPSILCFPLSWCITHWISICGFRNTFSQWINSPLYLDLCF